MCTQLSGAHVASNRPLLFKLKWSQRIKVGGRRRVKNKKKKKKEKKR